MSDFDSAEINDYVVRLRRADSQADYVRQQAGRKRGFMERERYRQEQKSANEWGGEVVDASARFGHLHDIDTSAMLLSITRHPAGYDPAAIGRIVARVRQELEQLRELGAGHPGAAERGPSPERGSTTAL